MYNLKCFSKLNEKPCFWFGCSRNGECILKNHEESKQAGKVKNPKKIKTPEINQIKIEKHFWRQQHPERVVSLISLGHDAACACCYTLDNLTFDHIKPLSKGGANTLKNGQILCFNCNQAKADKEISLEELRKLVFPLIQGRKLQRIIKTFSETEKPNPKEIEAALDRYIKPYK